MGIFRFAILGAGLIARKFCDAAALAEDCCVTAVASKSMARAQALAAEKGIPAAYDSYEELLAREKPDCAYIATTCDSHFELAMLCARHGVAVLCEKAMFTGAGEAETFFREASDRGVFAMEALWSRFLPANRQARKWVSEGRIGPPVLGEMNIGFAAPPSPDNRYFNPALGGGASNDLTVYGVQIMTWILDAGIEKAQAQAVPAATGVDATNIVTLKLTNGVPAVISSSFLAPLNDRITVYGPRGRVEVPHPHYASEAFLYAADGSELEHYVDTDTVNGFTYEIEEVMRCVRSGRRESEVVPQSSTLACARVFDLIRASLRA